ncbi:MAG: sugar-binding domain-containing protein, partial [Planctomycetota bacterium]
FEVPLEWDEKRISVEFDGAMANAHVWINGNFVGTRPYGYIGFEFDITDKIEFGKPNTAAYSPVGNVYHHTARDSKRGGCECLYNCSQ